jgi:hypothetical protein
MAFLRSLATVEEGTVSRASRQRRWGGKVLGGFLQQRWRAAGGSRRVSEVVGMLKNIRYRGKQGLHTYQRVEGDEAESVAKFAGSSWSESVGISHQSSVGGRRDPFKDEGVDLGQTEASGDVREVRKIMGSRGTLFVASRSPFVVGITGESRRGLRTPASKYSGMDA